MRRVLPGKSPLCPVTEFSGAHGKKWDGNTVLAELAGQGSNRYVVVARDVREFSAEAPVVRYVSPVGNSGVPYPYAVDEEGRTYLLAALGREAVLRWTREKFRDDPWDDLTKRSRMTADASFNPPQPPYLHRFADIAKFKIGGSQYTLMWEGHPRTVYDDVMKRLRAKKMSVRLYGGGERVLDRDAYAALMKEYGDAVGVRGLVTKLVVPRNE